MISNESKESPTISARIKILSDPEKLYSGPKVLLHNDTNDKMTPRGPFRGSFEATKIFQNHTDQSFQTNNKWLFHPDFGKFTQQSTIPRTFTTIKDTERSCDWHSDVFSSTAVVLSCNRAYMPCLLKLVSSILTAGKWQGDIILLVGVDFIMTNSSKKMLNYACVQVRRVVKWYDKTLPHATENPNGDKWMRMHLFTDPFFRKYNALMYMDTDGLVQHELRGIFKILDTNTIVIRDNGIGISKDSFFKQELLNTEFGQLPNQDDTAMTDTLHPGASCLFVVNMTKLRAPVQIEMDLYYILEKYGQFFRYNDQTLLNLYFRRQYSVMAPCFPEVIVVHPDQLDNVTKNWHRVACRQKKYIYVHDYMKKCLE